MNSPSNGHYSQFPCGYPGYTNLLQGKGDQELERFYEAGMIEPVDFAEWVPQSFWWSNQMGPYESVEIIKSQ